VNKFYRIALRVLINLRLDPAGIRAIGPRFNVGVIHGFRKR